MIDIGRLPVALASGAITHSPLDGCVDAMTTLQNITGQIRQSYPIPVDDATSDWHTLELQPI